LCQFSWLGLKLKEIKRRTTTAGPSAFPTIENCVELNKGKAEKLFNCGLFRCFSFLFFLAYRLAGNEEAFALTVALTKMQMCHLSAIIEAFIRQTHTLEHTHFGLLCVVFIFFGARSFLGICLRFHSLPLFINQKCVKSKMYASLAVWGMLQRIHKGVQQIRRQIKTATRPKASRHQAQICGQQSGRETPLNGTIKSDIFICISGQEVVGRSVATARQQKYKIY